MTRQLLVRIVLCSAGIVVFMECEASCWPDVIEQQAMVVLAYDRSFFDADRSLSEREKLREELRKCDDDVDFFRSLPSDHVVGGTYSILGVAIVADDPKLTEKYLERLERLGLPEPDDLMYEGRYVALAAFFESERALGVLLDKGMSAHGRFDGVVDTPIIDAQVFTVAGLRVISMLVNSGAGIEAVHSKGPSSIEVAAWHGDLMKVQCLYAFGATLPLPTSTEEITTTRSFSAIKETNSFLSSDDKEIPELVSEICSLATG